jgi:acyl-CoA hydrolase
VTQLVEHHRRHLQRPRARTIVPVIRLPDATAPETVLEHIQPGTSLIVPLANGEPHGLLDAIESAAPSLEGVTVHQMHALIDRPYIHGAHQGRLDHVSYFLSHVTRPAFAAGTIDLIPCHFSEMPALLGRLRGPKLVIAAASMPDRHGYVSLGTNADYVAAFVGKVPFFVECNARMPRTFGRNQLHLSQLAGWSVTGRPLMEVPPAEPEDLDRAIGLKVAERIPNGATIQTGIGAIPNAVLSSLKDHENLGIHTELLSDGAIDLITSGTVNGVRKVRRPGKVVATFALGTQVLYDFINENPVIEFLPVDWVNDSRLIGADPCFVSINATTEVDLMGQCASETIGGRYWSGSGGQADFARGAMYSERGKGFIVLHSTAAHGTISRIVSRLSPGSVVTTIKNTVDHVVTEHGVAELRDKSLRQRAKALIAIAAPQFRDQLTRDAEELGYL